MESVYRSAGSEVGDWGLTPMAKARGPRPYAFITAVKRGEFDWTTDTEEQQ